MPLIKVTEVGEEEDQTRQTVINSDRIILMLPKEEDELTVVVMDGLGQPIGIKETPEQVQQAIDVEWERVRNRNWQKEDATVEVAKEA